MLRILFERKGEELVGRFHQTYPICCKNPLTGKRINGEVEFYKIINPEIGLASGQEIADKATEALRKVQLGEE